ncbi:MAG: sce7726 family protein [Acidimicrobiales bacterium]
MRDGDVRGALHSLLNQEHRSELAQTRFVDELDLCGQVRVDVAVINGQLSGYELKSERDTLRRLPAQVEMYSRVLDRATLVVAERHLDHARPLLPTWWGLMVASSTDEGVALRHEALPLENPNVSPRDLVQLLWRDEVLAELVERDLDRGVRSKSRQIMWTRLAENVPLAELRMIVRERLKHRERWRVAR